MAQIQEQTVTIKLSKLVRDGSKVEDLRPDGFETTLEALLGEIVTDESVIVEVVPSDD